MSCHLAGLLRNAGAIEQWRLVDGLTLSLSENINVIINNKSTKLQSTDFKLYHTIVNINCKIIVIHYTIS